MTKLVCGIDQHNNGGGFHITAFGLDERGQLIETREGTIFSAHVATNPSYLLSETCGQCSIDSEGRTICTDKISRKLRPNNIGIWSWNYSPWDLRLTDDFYKPLLNCRNEGGIPNDCDRENLIDSFKDYDRSLYHNVMASSLRIMLYSLSSYFDGPREVYVSCQELYITQDERYSDRFPISNGDLYDQLPAFHAAVKNTFISPCKAHFITLPEGATSKLYKYDWCDRYNCRYKNDKAPRAPELEKYFTGPLDRGERKSKDAVAALLMADYGYLYYTEQISFVDYVKLLKQGRPFDKYLHMFESDDQ